MKRSTFYRVPFKLESVKYAEGKSRRVQHQGMRNADQVYKRRSHIVAGLI